MLAYPVSPFPLGELMDEQRKYAILFAATILAARKLNEIGAKPCPARECAIIDATEEAKRIPVAVEAEIADAVSGGQGPLPRQLEN